MGSPLIVRSKLEDKRTGVMEGARKALIILTRKKKLWERNTRKG